MISIDTNILLPAVDQDQPLHGEAVEFFEPLQKRDDVVLSEFVLLELYGLLRNPVVLAKPLSASVAVCQDFRRHPRWQVVGFPPESRAFHDVLWSKLGEENFARRRTYDWRAALSLLRQGVTEFATVNVKDFQEFGFARVWNPLVK